MSRQVILRSEPRPEEVVRREIFETRYEETKNEHLDNFVRDFADRMDHWFLGLPCGRRADSPAARVRGNLPDLALCHGKKRSLIT